jgi:hypothetical protein
MAHTPRPKAEALAKIIGGPHCNHRTPRSPGLPAGRGGSGTELNFRT